MRMTIDEIKLISFIVITLLVGASVKHYRTTHPRPMMSTPLPKKVSEHPSSRDW